MSDEGISQRIERLVAEEEELRSREQSDRTDDDRLEADQDRLRAVEIELDQCWDLLRQRRALAGFLGCSNRVHPSETALQLVHFAA